MTKARLIGMALTLAACATAPETAHEPSDDPVRIVTSGTDSVIRSGGWQGMLWLSQDFDGTQTRTMEGNRLHVEVEQRAARGGLDAGVGLYTRGDKPEFGELHPASRACFRFDTDLAGEGLWWAGPKVSINWQRGGGPDGAAGWYENYIVETASRSPTELAEGLMDWGQGVYLGETSHDDGTYRHYRAIHRDWTQYWAIRQEWRDSGTTSLGPVFAVWRADGLPADLPFDGTKLNIETYGPIGGEFTIEGKVRARSPPRRPACLRGHLSACRGTTFS